MTENTQIKAPAARFRYAPTGSVALLPAAFGAEFSFFAAPPAPFELSEGGKVAVVAVNGPLTLSDPFCETYNAVLSRVQAALASEAKCVVLKINSPGGEVFGVFDCARALKAAAAASGKPLVAFTEAMMCSSAYALGCAASEIVAADTAMVGSIGVIRTTVDITRQDQALGALVSLITSGARKSDGNPHVAFTDEARASMQIEVDAMASVFFEHVGLNRSGKLNAAGAQALEAASKIGAQALEAGLCDRVESWASLLARLGADEPAASASTADAILTSGALVATKSKMADNEKDDKPKEDAVRAALVTASESDDPKKASRAKAALASYDSDEDDKDKDKASASAAASDDDEKKALRASVAALSASVQEMRAVQQATAQAAAAAERSAFLASRPDLTKEQLAAFEKLPFESLKAIVATLPPAREFKNPLVPSVVASVNGADGYVSQLSLAEQADLDSKFGLSPKTAPGVVMHGIVQQFGVKVPVTK